MDLFHFPGIIGALDCTHISIITPPAYDAEYPGRVYFNRKGYASINTQIVIFIVLYLVSLHMCTFTEINFRYVMLI